MVWYYVYKTVLSCNIWLELEPEPETKQGTKVEPEPKINNFGAATLPSTTLPPLPKKNEAN